MWELPADVIMLRNPKQAFFFFLSRPETTKHRFLSLQVKTSESVQAVKDTVLFYPLVSASCIRWYVLWWTSISVLAGASATVFYPQHEGDPTQFDRLKVWCCGRRLAALLVLSEPIRGSERVAAQKHNLHILTGLLVTKGIFLFHSSLLSETDLTWYFLYLRFTKKQKPQRFSSHSCHHRLWTQHNLNHNY